ncbi:MAG TPA: TetR/AcrR family transcriptional regulator [Burkholderiaceae bacterium]|nr:TetR/AcrR family transcriptional regulator [Burkholderiaceae bacterium]
MSTSNSAPDSARHVAGARLPSGGRPPRRTQTERSETTQRLLIEATVKLLRVRGYGGLRTVEVSEVAGVSRGAQLHHFPTKNALVIATMRHLNRQMLEHALERTRRARASADPLALLIEDAFDFFFGDYFFITLAIGMSDERNQELLDGVKPYMAPSRFEVERQWQSVLEAAGMRPALAAEVLSLTLSVVRGYAVRTLLAPVPPDRFAKQVGVWKRLVNEYVQKEAGRQRS